jgi:Maltose acetyltransferase
VSLRTGMFRTSAQVTAERSRALAVTSPFVAAGKVPVRADVRTKLSPNPSDIASRWVGDMSEAERPKTEARSMRERMLAGDLYIADDPDLAEANRDAIDLMDAYNTTSVQQGPLRRRLLEALLGSVGESTEIRPPLYVDYGSHTSIGARCFANFGLVALDVAPITIGDDGRDPWLEWVCSRAWRHLRPTRSPRFDNPRRRREGSLGSRLPARASL